MRHLFAVLLFACAAHGAVTPPASAEESALDIGAISRRIVLRKSDCSPLPFDEEALASRLRVELAELAVRSVDIESAEQATGSAHEHEITVKLLDACSNGELSIVISDQKGPDAQRSFNVRALDRAVRERSLALAITELFRSRSTDSAPGASKGDSKVNADSDLLAPVRNGEVRPAPPEETEIPDHNASDLLRPPRPEPEGPPMLLSAGIEWRFLLARNTALTGGRLAASFAWGSGWLVRVSGEAGAFYDSEEDGVGAVELWLITGGVGVSAGYSWKRAELGLGPRLELGWGYTNAARSRGSGAAHSDSGTIVIASMVATGRALIGSRLWLSMDLELGHVLRGLDARALERAPLGISGVTGGGRLGVAIQL